MFGSKFLLSCFGMSMALVLLSSAAPQLQQVKVKAVGSHGTMVSSYAKSLFMPASVLVDSTFATWTFSEHDGEIELNQIDSLAADEGTEEALSLIAAAAIATPNQAAPGTIDGINVMMTWQPSPNVADNVNQVTPFIAASAVEGQINVMTDEQDSAMTGIFQTSAAVILGTLFVVFQASGNARRDLVQARAEPFTAQFYTDSNCQDLVLSQSVVNPSEAGPCLPVGTFSNGAPIKSFSYYSNNWTGAIDFYSDQFCSASAETPFFGQEVHPGDGFACTQPREGSWLGIKLAIDLS